MVIWGNKMDELIIRKAVETDIDEVEKIYNAVLDKEKDSGKVYTNWQKGLYPTRNDAVKAFKDGTLYVGEINGQVAACVNLNHIQPEEYFKLNWSIKADGKEVLVIHTLCISPEFAGRKIGERFVAFTDKLASELKYKTIRLDTYEGNIPAASLYKKMGYKYIGSEEFNFQNVIMETLICFDKAVI